MIKRITKFLSVGILISLCACATTYIMDRNDEVAQISENEHQSFYNTEDFDNRKIFSIKPTEIFYIINDDNELSEITEKDIKYSKEFAMFGICEKNNEYVLRVWKRFETKFREFKINIAEHANNMKCNIVFALPQASIYTSSERDYEIFNVSIINIKGNWEIETINQLTKNKIDDIQPVLNKKENLISYTTIEKNKYSVHQMNLSGEYIRFIAENASLPYFVPNSNNVIFVKEEKDGFRDFYVYEPIDKHCRKASVNEIQLTNKTIPYSSLKTKYMLIDNFKLRKEYDKSQTIYFKDVIFTGLRNAPEIVRDHNKLVGGMAKTIHNITEEGASYYNFNVAYTINDTDNLLSFINGLSIPIIPNTELRDAQFAHDRWNEEVLRCTFHQTVNKYISKTIQAYFSYIENDITLEHYKKIITLNKKRYNISKKQKHLNHILEKDLLYADSLLDDASSEYNNAVEELIASQYEIPELMGYNSSREIVLSYPNINNIPKLEIPTLEWFQAQGTINHPNIQQLNFMIMRAAAIRDLGTPSKRNKGIILELQHGIDIGTTVADWFKVSSEYLIPLQSSKLSKTYYEQWTAEIQALKQERKRVKSEIRRSIHEAYKDFNVLSQFIITKRKSRDFHIEKLRVNKIYAKIGALGYDTPNDIMQPISDEIDVVKDNINIQKMEVDYFKRIARVYETSGISSKFLKSLLKVLDENKIQNNSIARGMYLWESIDVISNKEKRQEFISLCKNRDINKVYCFISRTKDKELYLEKYDLEFSYFLQLCNKNNIKVFAMMGNSKWIKPSYKKEITSLLHSLKSFNENNSNEYNIAFEGLKLDVEPHSLSEWHTDERSNLCEQYIQTLNYVSGQIGKENLTVDISYHYNDITFNNKELLVSIANVVDEISVMAYLNKENQILNKTIPILERSDIKCKVAVSLETAPSKEKGISFAGFSYNQFEEVVQNCKKQLQKYKSFSGLVFHDFKNYKKLNP